MADRSDDDLPKVFQDWARLRLPTSAPEISEHGENRVSMFSDELYALLREACDYGYERGAADGWNRGAADIADMLRPPPRPGLT